MDALQLNKKYWITFKDQDCILKLVLTFKYRVKNYLFFQTDSEELVKISQFEVLNYEPA